MDVDAASLVTCAERVRKSIGAISADQPGDIDIGYARRA
jgi:hypothetical protein